MEINGMVGGQESHYVYSSNWEVLCELKKKEEENKVRSLLHIPFDGY